MTADIEIVFYEHDLEWYASNRDMPEPAFCEVRLFDDWASIRAEVRHELRSADVAVVGSYFPDGMAAIDELARQLSSGEGFLRHRYANHAVATAWERTYRIPSGAQHSGV